MSQRLALGLLFLLSGCVSERHFIRDSWPFGNPNAPIPNSETATRALGRQPAITPIPPQAGDVWPGPVQPIPTIGEVQQQMNVPLGQGFTPSTPSPYPPGIDPNTGQPYKPGAANSNNLFDNAPPSTPLGLPGAPATGVPLYNNTTTGGLPLTTPQAMPGVSVHNANGGVGPLVTPAMKP